MKWKKMEREEEKFLNIFFSSFFIRNCLITSHDSFSLDIHNKYFIYFFYIFSHKINVTLNGFGRLFFSSFESDVWFGTIYGVFIWTIFFGKVSKLVKYTSKKVS